MFQNTTKDKKTSEANGSKINMIGNGTVITGEVRTDNDIRIDGRVKGTIHSSAKVVIGETSVIEGHIYCQNVELYGEVTGDIYAMELMHLKGTAKVKGDIFTKKIIIEAGADFNGKCEMNDQPNENFINSTSGEQKPGSQKEEKVLR
jgi:cytoskeletal protein CcmA (bactofilin family)